MNKLVNELPVENAYHNAHHTQYVVEKAKLLAGSENITGRDLELIKIAALYHDTGFLIDRVEHEKLGCQIAFRDLQDVLTTGELENVCGMVNATKIPQNPQNIMEKIVADADLFYLGTTNYRQFSKNLYMELKHFDPSINGDKWLNIQVDFLSSHCYHTKYGKKVLEPVKQKNLKTVK